MQPKPGKIGVVTVTYNSEQVLPDFFASLWAQTHTDFVLYAVDNASKDRSVELLRAQTDSRLRIIANQQNVGVAEGNNQGIRAALADSCDAVLLLNNDVAFEHDLLKKLIQALGAEGCSMVAPKTTYFEPNEVLWWAGGHFQEALGWRTTHRGYQETDHGQYDTAEIVSYAPTCCVLIARSVFDRIGCFDSKYFVYYDDTDFMFRAHRNGCRLLYLPSPVLRHKVSSLTRGGSPFAIRYMTRNRVYFWLKHFGHAHAFAGAITLGLIYILRVVIRRATVETLRTQMAALREGFQMRACAADPATAA